MTVDSLHIADCTWYQVSLLKIERNWKKQPWASWWAWMHTISIIFMRIFFFHVPNKKEKHVGKREELFHRIFILLKFTCGCNCTAQSDYASSDLIIFHRNNLNRRPANKLPILMPFIIILFESEVPLLELEIYRILRITLYSGNKKGRKRCKNCLAKKQKEKE